MFFLKSYRLAALGIILAILFAVTSYADNTLRRGIGSQWETLDPQKTFDAGAGYVIDEVYEGLINHDFDGKGIPGAAEKWDVSDDGKTWTFHLRDHLKWSDGSPVVAQDYVNGILRRIDKELASPQAYYFYSILSVKNAKEYNEGKITDPMMVGVHAPDEKTVVLEMSNPYPNMLTFLSSFSTAPVHTPSLEATKGDFTDPGKLAYNGAYMITEIVPQSHVTMVKNPHYWNAANVKIDKLIYYVTEDVGTELKRYKAGELDITEDIPVDQTAKLLKEIPDEVHITPSVETIFYSFNITKPPLDNKKLRMALSYAIDRKTLAEKIVKDGRMPHDGFVVSIDPTYHGPKLPELELSDKDREAMAKQLFAEAGFKPGQKLDLEILSTVNAAYKKQAEGIALMWKKVLGVDIKVKAQDKKAWLDAFNSGNWTIFSDDLFGDFPGAETYLDYMRPSSESGYNWKNQQYEDLMDQVKATSDLQKRNDLLAQVEKVLLDEYLTAPLAGGTNRHLAKTRVKGWKNNPANWGSAQYLELTE